MAERRLDYLDMVKGIGIILVVAGHSTYVSDETLTWLASFHMPLFFILSGILFAYKGSDSEPFAKYAGKRFAGMMIPYFWFSLIYIGVDFYYLYAHPEIMNLTFIWNAVLQAISLFGISVLWFLPAIFMGELGFYGLVKRCKWWMLGILACVFPFVPVLGMKVLSATLKMEESWFNIWLGDLIMALLRVFPAITFLIIGYGLYCVLMSRSAKPVYEILLGIGCMVLNAAVAFANGRVDMHFLVFNNVGLFYLGACSAAVGLILICRNLRPVWLLCFLGSNSLIIMLTHLDCQLMNNAIRFAMAMNQFITRAKDLMLRVNLYAALLVGELVCIVVINRYLFFLIGRRKPVKMQAPAFLEKQLRKFRGRNWKRIK